jgi:hypothetical protein
MSHIPLSETYLVETTWTVLWANPGYRGETPMINHLHIHRFIDTINCRATHFWHESPQWARASSLSRLHVHTQTLHSVGLLWTSDQPDAEASTWHHTTLTTDIHAPARIRTRIPSKQAATDLRLSAANDIGVGLRIVQIIDTKCS